MTSCYVNALHPTADCITQKLLLRGMVSPIAREYEHPGPELIEIDVAVASSRDAADHSVNITSCPPLSYIQLRSVEIRIGATPIKMKSSRRRR